MPTFHTSTTPTAQAIVAAAACVAHVRAQTSTPTSTSTKSSTPTGTKSATSTSSPVSLTATPSQTGTPSNPSTALFAPSSVVVLRVGSPAFSAVTTAPGLMLPVYLDEVAMAGGNAGSVINTVALPIGTCMLSKGGRTAAVPYTFGDVDGLPSLSGDGKVIIFGCYALAAGAALSAGRGVTTAPVTKVVAMVDSAGTVDVSTSTQYVSGGTYNTGSNWFSLTCATTQTAGLGVYLAAGVSFTTHNLTGGYNLLPTRVAGSNLASSVVLVGGASGQPGYDDSRCAGIYNGVLYGTDGSYDSKFQGFWAANQGLPTVSTCESTRVSTAARRH